MSIARPLSDPSAHAPSSVVDTSAEGSGTRIYQSYRAALLSPQRVKELSRLRPARVVFDTAWAWLMIVSAWALVAWKPEWWTVLIAIPLIGTRYYALFVIGHDGMHRRLFNNPRVNDLFCD